MYVYVREIPIHLQYKCVHIDHMNIYNFTIIFTFVQRLQKFKSWKIASCTREDVLNLQAFVTVFVMYAMVGPLHFAIKIFK